MTKNEKVLISGASVGGPALAYFLHHSGYDVTVVERASARRTGGLAVGFSDPVFDVLAEMNILDQLRAHDTKMGSTAVVDTNGTEIGQLPTETFSGVLEVPKRELTRLLHKITADDVEYVFDDSITKLTQHPSGVSVEFENRPDEEFDLVFGADGLHSKVRRLAFAESAITVSHLGISTGCFTTDNYLGLNHSSVLRPIDGTAVLLFNDNEPDQLNVSLSFRTDSPYLDRSTRDEQEEAVRAAFAGHEWEVPRLLKVMPDAGDWYFFSCCQVNADTWSSGRVALVGDAGYCAAPTSGRGTSQALLGARTLARALAASSGDYETAFAVYEAEMRPYVAASQEKGRLAAAQISGHTDAATKLQELEG
ncbi:FAD-dependent monooxygenase [Amycolatopsis panacis]|uniref:FAD-dependent oxidoreductase n=1 Tax=Amycolatopsis panacis TaxID=2340917 RepID=A0A419HLP1_9PSEU|nr:FAD-dependent monooxygenase [Amycolatopsis panacis]RJQ77026.1 FAD-dependent oxidoreductase [Amycolatopsis panacis]